MKLTSGAHLGYCTNIHPGETWQEVRAQLLLHVPSVRRHLSLDSPLGLGLRLSAQAARQLQEPAAFAELLDLLNQTRSYVFTLNGFPFGEFHHGAIKERVYSPDWSSEERVRYTLDLGELLVQLAPLQVERLEQFSISTVPGGFRPGQDASSRGRIARHLAEVAFRFHQLEQESGVQLGLALEPEPACLWETTAECVAFLTDELFSGRAEGAAAAAARYGYAGLSSEARAEVLRRHLGLCLDACHAAVQFEQPEETVALLRASGVNVFKLQATAGLRLRRPSPEALARLGAFAEGVYLHQGSIRRGDSLRRFVDLPEVLETRPAEASAALAGSTAGPVEPSDEEWRVHFHVPVFEREWGLFGSTQDELREFLLEQRRAPFTQHIEVETYTFDVLPEEFRQEGVARAIAREIAWTRELLEEERAC